MRFREEDAFYRIGLWRGFILGMLIGGGIGFAATWIIVKLVKHFADGGL